MPNTGFYVSAPLPAWQAEKRLGRIEAAAVNIVNIHQIFLHQLGLRRENMASQCWQAEKTLGRIGGCKYTTSNPGCIFWTIYQSLMLSRHIFNLYTIRLANTKETRQNRGLLLIYSEYTPIKRGLMF